MSAEELDRLVAYLEGHGYRVRLAEGVGDRTGNLAGTAARRAAGVMSMFPTRPWCSRDRRHGSEPPRRSARLLPDPQQP